MKQLILVMLLIPGWLVAQEYAASNGKVYKIGDKIQLNQGSGMNGDYLFIVFPVRAYANTPSNKIDRRFNGLEVIVKDIRKKKVFGQEKVIFTVSFTRARVNYILYIDDALRSCEIADCELAEK